MSGGYTLGTIRGTIKIDYDGAGIVKANEDINKVKKSGESTSAALHKTSTVMAVGGALIAGGFAVAFNAASKFEKGLSGIQAVSGATGQQMDQIRAKALKLGADTAFSANDAAGAMEELVKAGVSVTDVLNGAADATVALAAAGGISLPEAATISANAMNAFGLKAQELPRVADLIAGAANASAIDVSQFGQSLQQSGAVAHLAGVSFDDLSVAIAEMGNAGIKGSDAGTSIKTLLQNLIPQTKQQKNLFDDLGITTNGLGNKFFDASGKVKSLAQVSQVLQDALKGQTKEQQLATLQTLFGSDAIRAAAILADNGAAGFDKLAASMGKTSAADVAATRMNNFAGKLEQLKGSADTLAITIGTLLLPAVSSIVTHATSLVNAFSGLSPAWQATIAGALGVIAGILLLGAAIVKIIEIARAFMVVWELLNLGFLFSPVGLVIIGIVALIAAIALLWEHSSAFRDFWIGVWNGIWSLAQSIGAWFAGPFANFFVSLWSTITGVFTAIWTTIVTVFTAIWTTITGVAQAIWSAIVTAFNAIKDVISAVLNFIVGIIQAWISIISGIFNFLAPLFSAIFGLIVAVISTAWSIITAIFAVAATIFDATVGAALRALWSLVVFVFNAWVAIITAAIGFIWPYILGAWNSIVGGVSAAINAMWSVIVAIWSAIVGYVSGVVNNIKANVVAAWNSISSGVSSAVNAVRGVIFAVWGAIAPYISAAMSIVRSIVSSVWNGIVAIVRAAVQSVINVINGISAIVSAVGRFFNELRNAAQGGTGSLIAFVAGIPGRVLGALGGLGSLLYNSGRSIIEGLVNGISSMIGAVSGAVGKVMGAARKLLPFSPAKEGPFSGRGWTLYSGMSMMAALAKGIAATADLPIQAMSGVLGSTHTPLGTPTAVGGSQTTSSTNITGPSIGSVTVNVPAPITDPDSIATYTAQKISTALATATTR
jgi:TP901 family phage tail tape measure protein